jgi:hypothetical protein
MLKKDGSFDIIMNFDYKNMLKNPYNLAFIALLIFTIYIRFRYLLQESIWVDETHYYLEALTFLKTGSLAQFTPFSELRFMPFLLILFWSLFFEIFTAGRMMALTYATLGIVYTYLVGKELKNELTGLIAAILVTFNPYIWFHSSRTLIDSPVTTMFIISAYYLIKLEKQYSTKNIIYLILALVLAIQTKFVGALFIFVIILYYLIRFIIIEKNTKELLLELSKNKLTYGALGVLAVGLYFVRNFITWGLSSLKYNPFFLEEMPAMSNNIVFWLAMIGIIISFAYKKREYLVIVSWLIVYYAAFTLMPANNDLRYILPAIPALLILSAIAINEIIDIAYIFIKKDRKLLSLIVLVIFLYLTIPDQYTSANNMILRGSYAFTGYGDAGKWIVDNVPDGAIVYTMSTSWANLFSENVVGRITIGNTAQFKTIGDLNEYLSNVTIPFYLIIDQWEAGAQPNWQPTQEKINQILSLGFTLEKVITTKYPTDQTQFDEMYNKMGLFDIKVDDRGLTDIPAVLIFKRQ